MFLQNDVVEYTGAPRRMIRILWIELEQELAHTFALQCPGAVPQPLPLHQLRADIVGRRARLLAADPCRMARRAANVPTRRQLRLQLKAWRAVQALHHDRPALYGRATRPALLAACSAQQGLPVATLLRYLRRYWERGQTIEALLPDYANSGARGRARSANAGVRRGRPPKAATA